MPHRLDDWIVMSFGFKDKCCKNRIPYSRVEYEISQEKISKIVTFLSDIKLLGPLLTGGRYISAHLTGISARNSLTIRVSKANLTV